MRCLVVGFGSIGRRHARLIRDAGHEVEIVSRQSDSGFRRHIGIAEALTTRFDYVVIANATVDHAPALDAVAASGHAGVVLVEKPIFAQPRALPIHRFAALWVGYNLRFHPCVQSVRRELAGRRAHSASAYVGQWLPSWRPDTDYRVSYSADAAQGGGVARDLSHEIDLAGWLFGPWRRLAALGGRFSALEIRSDDTLSMLAECQRCPAVQIHLDYLDRRGRRHLTVNHDGGTIHADLVAGTVDGARKERHAVHRDDTYKAMHRAVLEGVGASSLCSADEAMATLRVVMAAETSVNERTWRWL